MIKLNEHGLAVWKHKENKNLFVQRSYEWCDQVTVIDETVTRSVVDSTEYSTFDFTDWIPVTVEEYHRVKSNFKEIYDS